jgi:predicted MFS family arabinose efflux permease
MALPAAARFRDVFAVGEFRALWLAQAQSRVGDQFARVALALLVFDRTSSAGLTAVVYALTLLPPLVTASLLGGLVDRYPRRTVMVGVDLIRAAVIGMMAIPAMPLPVLAVLVVAATSPQPLFAAARNATLPNILVGDRFPVGMSIISSTDNLAQIIGFAVGGVAVAVTSPQLLLLVNAVTFVLSAALVRWGIRPHRPAPASGSDAGIPDGTDGRRRQTGFGLVRRDRQLLCLASLVWLYGFFLAPEALAVPYAQQIGVGDSAVGVLMAANVCGAMVGTLLVTRIRPERRERLTLPLALATGAPLVATVTGPPLPLTVVLWAASGILSAYLVLAQVSFTKRVPDAVRGRAIGFASAGLQTAQGAGVLLAGGFAEVMPPSVAIAVCAAAGSVGVLVVRAAFTGT